MKNLFIVAALFFTFQLSYSQGNLQFNKIIDIALDFTGDLYSTGTSIGDIVVPEGKIWKVKIKGHFTNSANYLLLYGMIKYKKSEDTYYRVASSRSETSNPILDDIYLDSGTYNLALNWYSNTGNSSITLTVNGIEYNVITE